MKYTSIAILSIGVAAFASTSSAFEFSRDDNAFMITDVRENGLVIEIACPIEQPSGNPLTISLMIEGYQELFALPGTTAPSIAFLDYQNDQIMGIFDLSTLGGARYFAGASSISSNQAKAAADGIGLFGMLQEIAGGSSTVTAIVSPFEEGGQFFPIWQLQSPIVERLVEVLDDECRR